MTSAGGEVETGGAPITATERRELRTLIRANSKLLLTQIKERETQLYQQIEEQLRKQHIDDKAQREKCQKRIDAAVAVCNTKIGKLVEEYPDLFGELGRYEAPRSITPPMFHTRYTPGDRRREVALATVRTQVSRAKSLIAKRELELLRQVAADALHTDAAREMAAALLTLEDLLPDKPEIPELES